MFQKTIFRSKWIATILQKIATHFFRTKKWKLVELFPSSVTKAVIVAAPHTTGFDLLYSILLGGYFKLPLYFIGKKELFIWPFKTTLAWLGVIPIDRGSSTGKTKFYGDLLRKSDTSMFLVIAPAGTRKNKPVEEWNRGYYYIALYAEVPLIFGFIDYNNKSAGTSFPFNPTGDYEKDMEVIKKFYSHLLPK